VFLAFCFDGITEQDYEKAIKAGIDSVVKLHEELDIDVLVHGEPEVDV
jgi:5-methyltetrahydropteroyltriglutamate--homocysteine methyltransferase